MGSLIAMDAEQKREANGRFGSGGYASNEKAEKKTLGKRSAENKSGGSYADYEKAERESMRGWAEDVDHVSSMSGEAGRQARKLARDCMTGRFRP